jgi:hypothetical protein
LLTFLSTLLLGIGEGRKNGNAVASMMWKLFELKGLLNGRTAKEINMVFDNCAGQNKNRMVYRMLFFMVKLGICTTARAIFLIKGHTKNDCDRMFNLMKYDYRKVNCYSPLELIAIVNRHPQVHAIPMQRKDFKNWDELENKMIDKMDGVKKNHVFTVDKTDSNTMVIQEHNGAPATRQTLVNTAFQSVGWKDLFILEQVIPPGLPDIKWNELYSKWGQFVPESNKKGLKYFLEKPPASLKKALAMQSQAAANARAKRTRGGKKESFVDHGKEMLMETKAPAAKRGRPKSITPPGIAKKRGRPKKETP